MVDRWDRADEDVKGEPGAGRAAVMIPQEGPELCPHAVQSAGHAWQAPSSVTAHRGRFFPGRGLLWNESPGWEGSVYPSV